MTETYRTNSPEETLTMALRVVGWIVSDQTRAQRMLDLTGLDPASLRAGLSRPELLRALLDFVLAHEPDLLACAQALDIAPQEIVAARGRLGR